MISSERKFAEDAALVLESMGLARAHGKLLAWLLVCDPPHQSSTDLAAALDLSAGSVSTGTRFLENARLIRRVAAEATMPSADNLRQKQQKQREPMPGGCAAWLRALPAGFPHCTR